ncbi:unnamed protein product [Brassica rapa subsp. trilocularis]
MQSFTIKQDQIHTDQISTFLDIASFPERPEPKGPALSSKKWSCCLAVTGLCDRDLEFCE